MLVVVMPPVLPDKAVAPQEEVRHPAMPQVVVLLRKKIAPLGVVRGWLEYLEHLPPSFEYAGRAN